MGNSTLVVYYSRTGKTKDVAEEISKNIGCDIERITDNTNRTGIIGFIKCGWEASRAREVNINTVHTEADLYDTVIALTPVWAGNIASPLREYLKRNKDKIKNAAFICTSGGGTPGKTLDEMESLIQKTPIFKASFSSKNVDNKSFKEGLRPLYTLCNK